MIQVYEIFHSIQGEGPFMGKPAVFIRLSGCVEPFCEWCDTKYACQVEGEALSTQAILDRLKQYACDLVVITGGEPFLQWKTGLSELVQKLNQENYDIQYETSGKVPLPDDPTGYVVCSPKYINNSWQFIAENHQIVDAFKFVIKDDFEKIKSFKETYHIPNHKVWLMPLGADKIEQQKLMPAIWDLAVRNQFNFSPRLHVLAFDQQRSI